MMIYKIVFSYYKPYNVTLLSWAPEADTNEVIAQHKPKPRLCV